jgi:hypothetical protein
LPHLEHPEAFNKAVLEMAGVGPARHSRDRLSGVR